VQTFRSRRAYGPREPAALSLEPFRAVRYCPGRVSGIAEVTSPPYDVIGPAAVARLRAADPHNVVRLILPRTDADDPDGGSGDAAATLKEWLADGVLVQDHEPALYAYEQRDRDGRLLQRGLIGGVGLSPPQDGVVLPHEDVMPGPVAGRLQLMETVRANLEPIFLLYDGAAGGRDTGHGNRGNDASTTSAATALVDQVATTRPPLLDVTTEDALTHRLWAITDSAEQAAIAADLAPRQALIADGHHRYAAYLELRSRMRAAGAGRGPWDQGLALLVDSAAYPPRIDPIHRVIPGLPLADAVPRAGRAFRVSPAGPSLHEALTALAGAGQHGPAFLIGGASEGGRTGRTGGDGQELHLLTDPDPAEAAAAMPGGRSPHWRGLDAAVMQQLLIGRLWGIRDDPHTVRVVHHDAQAAIRAAAESGGTAVICNPVSPADVTAVAADGERVPRKSTSFGPKPRTGLVIRLFDQG
jgi:uncharacterized protein (DUF1015 family)